SISGSYTLANQTPLRGTVRLALTGLTFSFNDFVGVSVSTAALKAAYDGTTSEVQIGATGATATLGGGSAPVATLGPATLAIVARRADGATDPSFALLATGDISLGTSSSATLAGH